MPYARQRTLFGGETVTGSIADKLEYILEEHPDARDDYRVAMVTYWAQFEGLDRVLGERLDAFRAWLVDATSPKTIQNRVMEIQNRRPDLEARSDVEELRQRQATAGPVGTNRYP